MHKYSVIIRETYLDFYGHLNNANYLVLLEEARWELITSGGYGMKTIQKLGQGPVILEVNLQFKKEIKARDVIEIQTSLVDYEGKVGHLKQEMVNQDGELCASAIFAFGLFDLKQRKLVPPSDAWKQALGSSQRLGG